MTTLLALEAQVPGGDREPIRELARWMVAQEAGNGWQGIRIDVTTEFSDPRARLARFFWAPLGRWELVSQGDPGTWKGYALGVRWGPAD
jgi:hypothetical protein